MRKLLFLSMLFLAAAAPAAPAVAVSVRPGGWDDVVKTPAGFELVRADGPTIIAERVADWSLHWSTTLPEPSLYLRSASDDLGTVEAIVQGNNSGLAYVVAAGGARSLGLSFGQNAVAIAWLPARGGFVYYVQTSPTRYSVFDAVGCGPCAVSMAATSQGFRDIQPDGTVRRGDDFITAPFNGRQLWQMAQRGDVVVGQCDPPGACAAVDGRTFTIFSGFAAEPHLALDGQTFAVAIRSDHGAALAIVSPPYPPADVAPVPPPPPPPPPPPAQDCGTVPDVGQTLLRQLAAKFPSLIRSQDDEERRQWARKAAEQMAFSVSPDWGTKNAGGGRPQSKDAIARIVNGTLCGWDIVNGATRELTFGRGEPLPGQTFVPVTPTNHLAGSTVPPPPPPVDDSVLKARVAALESQVQGLRQDSEQALNRIREMDQRLSSQIAELRAKPVDLSALQAAIDAALLNYEVNGKTTRSFFGEQLTVKLAVTKKK